MPRPRIELTESQISEVETLAAVLNQSQIADYFGMAHRTFQSILEREESVYASYKKGKAKAINMVAQGLLQKALGGDTASAIFYLKTQAGWRETDQQERAESPKVYIVKPSELPEDAI